jgi:ankyrin repeat protein
MRRRRPLWAFVAVLSLAGAAPAAQRPGGPAAPDARRPGGPAAPAEQRPGGPAALLDAVGRGDRAAVRSLLRSGADANATGPDGTTPLLQAVLRDDLELVDGLLGAGARATTANRYGVVPLTVACTNGNVAIIETLLAAGADLHAVSSSGETPLMTAARTGRVGAVKLLLSRGAAVDQTEAARGQTALMWAAAENHVGALQALVGAKADVTLRSKGGFTALLFAVREGKADAVRYLLTAGADPNDEIRLAQTAAPAPAAPVRAAPAQATTTGQGPHGGSDNPRIAALLRIFDTGLRGRGTTAHGTSAIVLAITNGHFELAAMLLDAGANPNASGQGWSALHQLAWTRRPPIQHGLPPAVPTGNVTSLELARKLLQAGANPNLRMSKEPNDGARNVLNRVGSTPFLQAAKLGDIEYMRLLVDHGADASIATEDQTTPLMAAAGVGIWQLGESAGSNEEAFEAVKLCHELGNDVNAVDANGYTALHGAAHRGANDIVKFLVARGARLDVVNLIGWTPYLIADGVFYPNTYNRRPETAALLLELGASPNAGRRREVDLPPSKVAEAAGLGDADLRAPLRESPSPR